MKAEEIIDLIDKYWKFDNNQQHASNWHDKQDLLELFRKSTPQPHPTMSAEKQMIDFSWWLVNNLGRFSDDMQAHFNGEYLNIWRKSESSEYRNQPIKFNPPHSAQHEAEVLFNKLGYHKSIQILEYTMLNLKAANVSAVWHEEVLTILKGM